MPGDGEIGLRQDHVDIRQQRAKERPFAVHAPQQIEPLGAILRDKFRDRRPKPIPAGQRQTRLPPGEAPGNGPQILHFRDGLREAGRDPMFSEAISAIGVEAKK